MNAATMNVDECRCTNTCESYTPKVVTCSICGIFPASCFHNGKPCCSLCDGMEEIRYSLKRIEKLISETKSSPTKTGRLQKLVEAYKELDEEVRRT